MIFEFDICVSSHDALKEGILCFPGQHRRTVVLADTYQEAELIALQMAVASGYVTRVLIRI